jgi:NAD(P)-dependent dehydrogenase (short-subunit alcohol dehydrogenase family)
MAARFEGKTYFISGGGGGIAAGIAHRLCSEGAYVALGDLVLASAEKLAQELKAEGGNASAHLLDVTSAESVVKALDAAEKSSGRAVDGAITCAGIVKIYPFLDLPQAVWERTLTVNLTGTFLVIQEVARRLVKAGTKGRLVSIASVAGRSGRPNTVDYAASKAGVISVVRSAALAFAPYGINVNAVCPGVVDTEMTQAIHRERSKLTGITKEESLNNIIKTSPLGRIQTPSDVADVVTFLLSDEGGYITGQSINACGGMEMD